MRFLPALACLLLGAPHVAAQTVATHPFDVRDLVAFDRLS
jgi:hypothetical protein